MVTSQTTLGSGKGTVKSPLGAANRSQVHREASMGTAQRGQQPRKPDLLTLSIPFHGNLGLSGNLLPCDVLTLACLLSSACTHPWGHGLLQGSLSGVTWLSQLMAIPGLHGICSRKSTAVSVTAGGCQGHLAFHLH